MFEMLKRDGLARIGRFETRSGAVETPALLPVVNPKICTVSPRELRDEFGFEALITNSYIIKNSPDLRRDAVERGLHEMLDFRGAIMTDSGTFQSHMYGEVEVTNEEMVEFQKSIGTDIGTVLDIFAEPSWTREQTAESIEVTLERTAKACSMKGEMMINGVVQGSVYQDLREDCARRMAAMDADVHPIGGIVPLMEQYRYSDLVDVVISSKKGLDPSRPVHLFGAGHPMLFALAALMGCDLFDSASYAKFARDDRLMFTDGTYRLQDMQSLDCPCPACRGMALEGLRRLGGRERTALIARHNLYQIKSEMALVKRHIREGRLWELAEARCRSHPALLDALRRLGGHSAFMERFEPVSRDGAMFYTGPETYGRPVFRRYAERLASRYAPPADGAAVFRDAGSKPYGRAFAAEFDRARRAGLTPVTASPFGPVPAELDEMYPIAQSVFPSIADLETERRMGAEFGERVSSMFARAVPGGDVPEGGAEEADPDLLRAKAVARYQFGMDEAEALFRGEIELVVSRKTGKIRNVVSDGEHVLSMRAGDGLYTLRMEGARRIASAAPAPRMRVAVSDDAAPFVSEGKNVFCRFVTGCDESLVPMDEAIVVDGSDRPIATGRLLMVAGEIRSFKKGMAVRVRSGSGEED
ncbi:MAG: tRNA guanosine(15) transglycosylase TgtA [Candidatus Methanoplasma sp.]|jgi:7-cyano-7-deazaguanine tRNA-ribosyltransferase|nr:tRNA guanosine(15) transglycosylase TgtA [Candidatus Methanoplasma sp.]